MSILYHLEKPKRRLLWIPPFRVKALLRLDSQPVEKGHMGIIEDIADQPVMYAVTVFEIGGFKG